MFSGHPTHKIPYVDCNSNVDPNYKIKASTPSFDVPKIVQKILQEAALEHGMDPAPPRPKPNSFAKNYKEKINFKNPMEEALGSGLPPVPRRPEPKTFEEKRRERINFKNTAAVSSVQSTSAAEYRSPSPWTSSLLSDPAAIQHQRNVEAVHHANDFQRPKIGSEMMSKLRQAVQEAKIEDMARDPKVTEGLRRNPVVHHFLHTELVKGQCTCQRPKKTVCCTMCGYRIKGNVKVTCPEHPQKTFLYDMSICANPKCKAPNYLVELND